MINEDIKFSCQQCSWCCRFEGGVVRLSQDDLDRLCKWAELKEEQFKKVYCRSIEDNQGKNWLILKTLQKGDCIFWDQSLCQGKGGCQCYIARPLQCSTYPFWPEIIKDKESWNKQGQKCPGINCGQVHPTEEINEEVKKYCERKPLEAD
ncbi:YkgJ family cysteine cluster protein [Treponema sp.]|uniref:YkgJ family cysteine cluster protein n=1 Tax=Treponema sp. TaxID=166 RepID=UPI0026013EAB|nr:YkgJ family cysteine cluster protein [Treponema sp.]MCR5217099.1 YkgJ family cysteine cluster protein [Treponema sp.]